MAEFQEVMRNYHRMCETAGMCGNCAFNKAIEEITDEEVRRKNLLDIRITLCTECMEYLPDKAEEVIQRWAAEHPEKPKTTMLEVLKEHFPGAVQNDGQPHICPDSIFECDYDGCGKISCAECWNRPAPDEYQEKDEL